MFGERRHGPGGRFHFGGCRRQRSDQNTDFAFEGGGEGFEACSARLLGFVFGSLKGGKLVTLDHIVFEDLNGGGH